MIPRYIFILVLIFFNLFIVSAIPQYTTDGFSGTIYYNIYQNLTTIVENSTSYNSTYATWLPNYTLYNKYWYNMTVGIGGGSSYNETYATWLPNFTLYNKYWYNMSDGSGGGSYGYNQTIPANTYTDTVQANNELYTYERASLNSLSTNYLCSLEWLHGNNLDNYQYSAPCVPSYEGTNIDYLNYDSYAGSGGYGFYAFRIATPPNTNNISWTWSAMLPSGVSSANLTMSIRDVTGNTNLNSIKVILNNTLTNFTVNLPNATGRNNYLLTLYFRGFDATSTARALSGKTFLNITLNSTGQSSLFNGNYTRFQIGPGMMHDDIYDIEKANNMLSSPLSRFVFDTNAEKIAVEQYSTMYGINASLAFIGVKVNGEIYTMLNSTTNTLIEIKELTLPKGYKRVELIVGSQNKPSADVLGTWIRAIYTEKDSYTNIVKPREGSRVMIVYGDSIANGLYTKFPNFNAWPVQLRKKFGGSVAVEGYGYGTLNDSFSTDRTNGLVNQMAKLKPTDIYLAIGTNDYGLADMNASNFSEAYGILLDNIHDMMPTAMIYAQSPIVRSDMNSNNSLGVPLAHYIEAIRNQSSSREYVIFINGTQIVNLSDLSDGIHPNANGDAKYADYVYNITNTYRYTTGTYTSSYYGYNTYLKNRTVEVRVLNQTYSRFWYNQSTFSYNLNTSYNLWWYNQSLYPITTLNTSYNKWWYNQTNGVETNDFIHRDGTVPLIANWNAGNYNISSQQGFQYNTTSPQGVSFNATCTIIKGTSGAIIEVC